MVPEALVPIIHVPCSSSGKANRRFLREFAKSLTREELGLGRAHDRTSRVPAAERERILQRLIANLLPHLTDIDMDDSFFKIGAVPWRRCALFPLRNGRD